MYVEAKIAYFTVIDQNVGTGTEQKTDSNPSRQQKAYF